MDTYDLHEATTFMRTTLRYPSFCRGWNKIIKLDLTNKNDHEEIKNCKTFADWFILKKDKFAAQSGSGFNENEFFDSEFSEQISYLGLNQEEKIPGEISNSALLLQAVLEKKLVMKPADQDMIIMLHEIEYSIEGENKKTRSCLIVKGEDQIHTAMAKTVGLPLGIAAKLILDDEIKLTGLHIPVIAEIYEPVLQELEFSGIKFNETTETVYA